MNRTFILNWWRDVIRLRRAPASEFQLKKGLCSSSFKVFEFIQTRSVYFKWFTREVKLIIIECNTVIFYSDGEMKLCEALRLFPSTVS